MAWNTEKTKALLLEAATAEFSAHGLAGARVDRIATSAGVSKERLYQYFGKKDELFGIVLERELAAVMDAVILEGSGIEAVVDYTGRVFDYQVRHPQLARLVFWEGLEREHPVAEEFRATRCDAKVTQLRQALPSLGDDEAREIILTILSLCDSWQVLATVDRVYTRTRIRTPERDAARRAVVVAAVEAYARSLLG